MAENIKVDLEENSPYRVAFDLLGKIAYAEETPRHDKSREYFLTLYRQCLDVVMRGQSYEDVKHHQNKE